MPDYKVSLPYLAFVDFHVEAATPKEALKAVLDRRAGMGEIESPMDTGSAYTMLTTPAGFEQWPCITCLDTDDEDIYVDDYDHADLKELCEKWPCEVKTWPAEEGP